MLTEPNPLTAKWGAFSFHCVEYVVGQVFCHWVQTTWKGIPQDIL